MSYFFFNFELDPHTRELRNGGVPIAVEPKAFDVLCMLIEHRDRVVSKDELIETVWQGRFISDSAVSTAIKAVRQAVGDDGRAQAIVRTIHGHGFRFVAELADSNGTARLPASDLGSAALRGNLRKRRRRLIGREAECSNILQALGDERIITILGPGGVGKSSLAIEAASSAHDRFSGGVWFCEFAPIRAGQLESAVLGAIDSSAGAGPVNAAMIADRFADEPTLLIFDNCEHVIGDAARVAEELIDAAPNLVVLATSREALEVPEEKLIHLDGLGYLDPNSTAVEMFYTCAEQARHLERTEQTDETVREITARLEGLPLAIELAAPRLASSSPEELLAALDDQLTVLSSRRRRGDSRHGAMDDAIAWSFDLLDPQERDALCSLSIFSGAFTAQAAEAICDTPAAREILHNLVSQSMVAFVPGKPISRFRLLEPIRQFARRQLDKSRLNAIRERHANWFARRVIELAEQMRGANEVEACEALTAEWSDFGRALAWGRAAQRPDICVAPLLALHIHLLWQLRIEAFVWLEEGVAACDLPTDMQAKADLVRSMGAWSMADLDRSEALMDASIRAGGESFETAYFQFYQGFAREEFEKVFKCGLKAWELARETNDLPWQITTAAFLCCGYAMYKGDAPEIAPLFDEIERQLADFPWPSGRCCALIGRTVAAFGRGAPRDVETFRIDLEKAANHCHAPWFKVTAAGIEASQTRDASGALAQLDMYTRNLKSALNSGDVIQLPTILRSIGICLADIEEFSTLAKLSGLIPHVRGLGEKGSLAPGYEGAVLRAEQSLASEAFLSLSATGHNWQLPDVVQTLEKLIENRPELQ